MHCINALTLSTVGFLPLVLSDSTQDLNEDVVYHIRNPILPLKINEGGRYIEYSEDNTVFL